MSEKLVVQLDRIARSLDSLEPLKTAAGIVRDAAVINTPVGFGQLKQSIRTDVYDDNGEHVAEVFTKKPYAGYVELGTGPKGAANHAGISPNISPTYTPEAWWIHESQLDAGTGEKYGWYHIDTKDGRFYLCYGQAAQPFLYPALADNKQLILKALKEGYEGIIRSKL